MKVTIELGQDDVFTTLGARLLAVLGGARLETSEPRTIKNSAPDTVVVNEAEAGDDSAASTIGAESANEASTPSAADVLIADLDGQYKRAKTVTLKGGAQGEEGVEVITADGEVGIIEACYRGRAIVSFEDGRAEEIGSSNLTVVPTGDEKKEEKAKEPETTGRRRRAASNDGDEGDELVKLCATVDEAVVHSLLQEFEVNSLAELEGDDRAEFLEIIKEEVA